MVNIQHWINDFTITDNDIESLNTLLFERETPLTTEQMATLLVTKRIEDENQRLQERFKDATLYDPAQSYAVGQRLVFAAFDYAVGEVMDVRPGDNGEYGEFSVIAVAFDRDGLNTGSDPREFAAAFPHKHTLNSTPANGNGTSGLPAGQTLAPADVFQSPDYESIIISLEDMLRRDESLLQVADAWFPVDLIIETNEGHMHLSEAVLDMYSGGPLTTREILENIGGLGNSPMPLQEFSMNYGLNQDKRFDEVGALGEILWYLRRLEPDQVQNTPVMLQYNPIPYDRDSLSPRSQSLEAELADEHSPLPPAPKTLESARIVLIYPHRRLGTLPLNHQAQQIFPRARKTERIALTMVDSTDGEEFPVWVVRKARYVHGLMPFYTKHALPIGATMRLRRSDEPGKIVIEFDAYKPRSEWITLVTANKHQIGFEAAKRGIGAEFDDLLLLGVDDLEGVDRLFQSKTSQQQPLATILRMIIPLLGGINAQGHVHAKTLYSAVNVLRRCPPGPILATLSNNPDFENVGEHYWRLSD